MHHDDVKQLLIEASEFEFEVVPAFGSKLAVLVRDDISTPFGFDVVEDEQKRLRIREVTDSSQCTDMTLARGDVILAINHTDVRGLSALQLSAFLRGCNEIIVLAVDECSEPLPEGETEA